VDALRVVSVRYDRAQLVGLVEHLAAGTLMTKVGAVLPPAEAAQAHRIIGTAEGAPKVVAAEARSSLGTRVTAHSSGIATVPSARPLPELPGWW
jgi:hypothetical protein